MLKKLFVSVCALACATAVTLAQEARGVPTVSKTEPPSWWARHTINPVRLLVRGTNLHGARVTTNRPETTTSAVLINPAGTYLFVNVHISSSARPGDYPLQVETATGKTTIPFSINAPLDPAMNFLGISNDDVIYLIMPDRFS